MSLEAIDPNEAEEEEPAEELSEEEARRRMRILVYQNPEAVWGILQELLDILGSEGIHLGIDVDEIIKRGIERWVKSE